MNTKLLFPLLIFISTILSCNNNQKHKAENKDSNDISSVPEWSKKAIWYQIFVERFRNGDKSNDPTSKDILGTYPDSIPGNWSITPWEQDWYKPDAYFAQSNLKNKWDNLQLRRYGGDLQGVMDELDYLSNLGINAIYFNPLNDSPSLHKYDPRTWTHIDRNFGPNPQKDIEIIASENPLDPKTWKWTTADSLFLEIIKKCHEKGIKVILDYSFNHTGTQFWAFKDIKAKGEKSEVADWYNIVSFDNPATPENEFNAPGWSGVPIMPEMKKDFIGQHKEMPFEGNLHSQAAKNHIFSIVKRWLDPNQDGNLEDGLDGYRLDVAAEVPMGFWREFRKVVRSVNPEAYIIGEIWWKKWPDELMFPNIFLEGDQFDAIMNYRWYRPTRNFFADAPEPMKPSEFVAELKDKLNGIDINRSQAMMNLAASHDAPRVSTSLYNKNQYKFQDKPYDNVNYKIDKPDAQALEIQKMLLIFQFTYIGAPHIWYGDEVGMWGADDPDTRKPMIWSDIQYDNETTHPFDIKRKTDKVEQDIDLLNYYKTMIQLRKENPALIYGEIEYTLIDDNNRTLAYSRTFESKEIVIAINKSGKKQNLKIRTLKSGNYKNALITGQIIKSENGFLNIEMEANHAAIYILE